MSSANTSGSADAGAAILHYIHDPLCGWCYGAAPLVKAAREVLPVHAHGGGLMTGGRRQYVTPQLRDYVVPHDRRIAQLTGQPFEDAYFEALLRDPEALFDSEPPIAAILAAERFAGRGLDLLSRQQTAHYVEGRRIADRPVLVELAADIGLDAAAFERMLSEVEGDAVRAHMAQTRQLMGSLGAQGFPTFALQQDGRMTVIDLNVFLGRPKALREWLREQVPQTASAAALPDAGCGPGGCAI